MIKSIIFSLFWAETASPLKVVLIGHSLGAKIFRPSDVSYAASTQISRHPSRRAWSPQVRHYPLFNPKLHFTDNLWQSLSLIWSTQGQKRPISMASILSTVGAGFSCSKPPTEGLKQSRRGTTVGTQFGSLSFGDVGRRVVVVRAEGQAINPEIRKSEDKVVDSVVVTELSKPLTAYCR